VGSGEESQVLAILVSGMAGLVVGSFLNVVVYRLPRRMSVVRPPSHCPSCGARLTLVDLVPVLSWVALRGRCRHCGARISWRYPVIEVATGVLCAGTAAAAGTVWPLPSVAVVLVCALAASIIDADGVPIPGPLALMCSIGALSLVPVAAAIGHVDRIGWAALGALLGFAAALVSDRESGMHGRAGIAVVASLALTAGWFWPGGGPVVAAWVVRAARRGVGRRRDRLDDRRPTLNGRDRAGLTPAGLHEPPSLEGHAEIVRIGRHLESFVQRDHPGFE
jgi:leader peptidase (prepilin peptidase)/N-methyltransferase